MSKLLEGKTAIVLGVWNKWSIAYAIAQAFVREGATLLLTYQNDRAKPTVEELGKELGAKGFFPCDVQQQSDIDNLAAAIKAQGHRLDAVVHCLAFANHEDLGNPFVNTSRAGFQLALEVSAFSLVAVSKALVPLMSDGGAIMTLTYLGSTRVVTNYNIMGVAKAALEASVKYLASELGKNKIRVNAISAGPIKTISARGIKDFSKVLEFVAQHAPLRRNTDIRSWLSIHRHSWLAAPERIPASSRILILRVSSATCSRSIRITGQSVRNESLSGHSTSTTPGSDSTSSKPSVSRS
jgi:enoyl-[acyl-carrier protein] reductase I